MLIELLALLIFLAFAFAFALKEEGDRVNPWKEKYDRIAIELRQTKEENNRLRLTNAKLQVEINVLNESIRRLLSKQDGTLAANDQIVPIAKVEFDKLLNDKALLDSLQTENAALRSQLQNGGTDRPNCLITSRFLINVKLLGNGNMSVSPAWDATALTAVETVPGAIELGKGGEMSRQQFLAKSAPVDAWARAQSPACGFRARVSENHGNLELYKTQVRTVEKYFYDSRQ